MRNAMTVVMIVTTVVLCLTSAWPQESFSLQGDWWQEPAQETRHTTLLASYDSDKTNDADYALGRTISSGYAMDPAVPGLHGSGAEVITDGGYTMYLGGSNINTLHGTMRMAVKGPIWADPTPRFLFESRAVDHVTNVISRIGVKREPGKLSLVFTVIPRAYAGPQEIARLDCNVGDVSTDDWHSVVASWDRASGTGWIALDGRGVTGPMQFSDVVAPAYVFYAASGAYSREPGGLNPAGSISIDDLVLYDQAVPMLEAQPAEQLTAQDSDYLPIAEAAARKTLNVLADLQDGGGWPYAYTWPTLVQMSSSSVREAPLPDDYYFNIDKGNSGMAVAEDFVYAYDVLGDHRFLEALTKMADALMAAQSPDGYWTFGYHIRPDGFVGRDMNQLKFQDHVQSYPMYFLAYMYRITGDQRYMDAVMKTGEFYITVQNPNGSYSHHYNVQKGIGETANGMPQGGELNDGATNDGLDVMAFMYHMTGDARYVRALKRIGDWLLEAQGKDIPLWADQYDQDNNPIWARDFEPPSYGYSATQYALDALRDVYRFSGDERYLAAMQKALAWIEANLPDGTMAYYIELGTARPIAAWEKKVYYLDQPEDVAYLNTVPIGSWELLPHPMLATAKSYVERAEYPERPPVTPAGALQSLPMWRDRAQTVLATQDESGLWVTHRTGMGTIGDLVLAPQWELPTVLAYIEQARMALGELPPERRGGTNPRANAYPYEDWYEVDWAANTQ